MKKNTYVALAITGSLSLALLSATPAMADQNDNYDSQQILNMAIIGDSYTSGNGAGNYYDNNSDASYYSLSNWGHNYQNLLEEQGISVRIVDSLAYSGSTTSDLLAPHVPANAKDANPGNQINRLSPDIDLVLMTIGGNDVYFADIITECFVIGMRDAATCDAKVTQARQSLTNPHYYGVTGEYIPSVKDQTWAILERLDATLKPSAEVVLVGYPLLATDRPYALTNLIPYYKYNAGAEVRKLGMEATALQQGIVDEWNSQEGRIRVHYVGSIATAFAGHEPDPSVLSRNNERWINEFLETETYFNEAKGKTTAKSSVDTNNWYHPGVTGHQKIAEEIMKTVGVPDSTRTILFVKPTMSNVVLNKSLSVRSVAPATQTVAPSVESIVLSTDDIGGDDNPTPPSDDPTPDPSPTSDPSPSVSPTPGPTHAPSVPSAWLQGPIGGYVGETVVFDARGSYSTNGKIVKYEWDFNGDGTYDQTSTQGNVSHRFTTPTKTTAHVRVTDSSGAQSIGSASVSVVAKPAPEKEVDVTTLKDKPGVFEVLDEEALALFPEDTDMPQSNQDMKKANSSSGARSHTDQSQSSDKGATPLGIAGFIVTLVVGGGIATFALSRGLRR